MVRREIMTQRPDDHLLAVEKERLSPVVVVVTGLLILLFVIAFLYRLGVSLL